MASGRKTQLGCMCIALFFLLTSGCSKDGGGSSGPVPEDSLFSDVQRDGYIYNSLSDEEKIWYNELCYAVENHRDTASFSRKLTKEAMRKIFVSVYYGEEYFWMSSIFYSPRFATSSMHIDYRFDREKCETIAKETGARRDEIYSRFDENTTDYEKLKTFHDEIVLGCTFTREGEYANIPYGALVDHSAQCEGYAAAFTYLCKGAGIECITVYGSNSTGALHAWNIVKLEGNWYHVDTCWDDPILDPVNEDFCRYYYFLGTDEDMLGTSHTLDEQYTDFPECTDSNSYFRREGLYCEDAEDAGDMLMHHSAGQIRKGLHCISLRCGSDEVYDTVCTQLFDEHGLRQILDKADPFGIADHKRYTRYLEPKLNIIQIFLNFNEGTEIQYS